MAWTDFFKLFNQTFTLDPLSKKSDKKDLQGSGVSSNDVFPDPRNTDNLSSGSGGFIRVQNDLVDLTSTTNRVNRYKEYDRLVASVSEIEMAMTVFADEACVHEDTIINTVYHGPKTIKWLQQNRTDDKFPVYCYDFKKEDYTIGWAYSPRFVKKAKTVRIILDNGESEIVTPDHRILKRNSEWVMAGDLKFGDKLMPFYRIKANQNLTKNKTKQFPRLFTFNKGWIHERQFIDEWRSGKDIPDYEKVNKIGRLLCQKITTKDIGKLMGVTGNDIKYHMVHAGFSFKEFRLLSKNLTYRRVIKVEPWHELDVYDLSVEDHKNFCTQSLVMHNCQKDEDGQVFKITCKNQDVKEELETLFYKVLEFDQLNIWDKSKRLFIKGDAFWEIVIDPDNPKDGILKIADLPPDNMYRIESTKGKVLEYQQAKEGPDYQALLKAPLGMATDAELAQSLAIRFTPDQIIHLRIGDYRKSFYPYGVSLIEPARGPAHQLRMMEDSMVVYRLCRAPERRIFYIDIGGLPSFKAEAFINRMKDQFRKKKMAHNMNTQSGPSAVDERWHAPAVDEDYWIPVRQNSTTRIDTLPGAQNLGEIDDTVYFRTKLFAALNFPPNYFYSQDANATRITLSAQDVKFAKLIERLQAYVEYGFKEIAVRHLKLIGYPEPTFEDLKIKMTPPSDWRELSRAEVITNRINNANSLKSSQLLSDYDILTKWMKYPEDEAKEMIARMKIQKLEDLKLQVLAQNPQLLGVGIPGQGEQEISAQPGGPTPMLGPDQQAPPGGAPGTPPGGPEGPPPEVPQTMEKSAPAPEPGSQAKPLPNPSDEEIMKYDLELQDYDQDQDYEEPDYSEGE